MKPITEHLEEMIEKRERLDKLKKQSSELKEAINLAEEYAEEYQELLRDLIDSCKPTTPTVVPMPYPVYPPVLPVCPTYPYGSYWYRYPSQFYVSKTSDTTTIDLTGTCGATTNAKLY